MRMEQSMIEHIIAKRKQYLEDKARKREKHRLKMEKAAAAAAEADAKKNTAP